METDKERRLKQKATFYFGEKLICHITKEPSGSVNGWFRSDLIDELYYLFEFENRPINLENGETYPRLFLCDIYDINDWRPKQ